jgi:GH24 family phage-related lysozyme (muramidase)
MAHFLRPAGVGPVGYDVDNKLAPGSVWRMQIPVGGTRSIALYGGAGLKVTSNNPTVVADNFTDRQSGDLRVLTLSGGTLGTSMLEVRQGAQLWLALQVQVVPPAPPAARTLSPAGVAFIARHEGLRLHMYNDVAGHATIGFGHLVHHGKIGTQPATEARFTEGISRPQALQILAQDSGIHVAAVRRAVRRPLTQNELDALVDLSFNIGAGGMAGSQVIRLINAGGYTPGEIQHAFLLWIHAGGRVISALVARRNEEYALFMTGRY